MGGTLGDAIKTFEDVPGQTVIRPRNSPLKKEGGMAILRGNLCPRGAVNAVPEICSAYRP